MSWIRYSLYAKYAKELFLSQGLHAVDLGQYNPYLTTKSIGDH